jgi:hypothetical protein
MKRKMLSFIRMKKILVIGFSCVFIGTAFISCSRGGVVDTGGAGGGGGPHIFNPGDSIPPIIDILTPTDDQAFVNGAMISVTGRVTDNGGLYHGNIRITDDLTGAIVKEQLYEIHGYQLYNFTTSYTTAVTTISNYTVSVTFDDHGYNVVTKTVKVKVNP